MSATTTVCLGSALALLGAAPATAQVEATPAAAARSEPDGLLSFKGTVGLFTLTVRGDIDGFVLVDGTEVKTPPHLSAAVGAAVRVGDAVTVLGLKAAGRPLVLATSLTDDASGRTVVDRGPDDARGPSPAADAFPVPTIRVQGRVRMALHGSRGDVNGVLFEDGTILRLPPAAAVRLAALIQPGAALAADGRRHVVAAGAVVEVTALGTPSAPLDPVGGGPFGRMPAAPPHP